MTIVVL